MNLRKRVFSFTLALLLLCGLAGLPAYGAAENPNLIKDPGMEGAKFTYGGWKTETSFDNKVFHSGKQSLKVVKTENFASVKFSVDLKKNKPYYYSAWALLGEGSTQGQVLRACLEYKLDGESVQKIIGSTAALREDEWSEVKGVYTIEESGDVSDVYFFFFTDLPPLPETYYLDDVVLRLSDGSAEESAPPVVPATPEPKPVRPGLKTYAEKLVAMKEQDGEDVSVLIDGELQKFDQAPVIINDRTMVPLRGIFEQLGAEVEWVAAEQRILAQKGNTRIELKIGSPSAYVDSMEKELDQPPQIVNDRTLVPIRFISEALGAEVYWNAVTRAVSIYGEIQKDLTDSLGRLSDKSILNHGDLGRLARVMRKAASGQPIMLGYMGASTTSGADASSEEKRYANLITAWFKEKFPDTKIEMVNAGLGATGSPLAVHRLDETLLAYEPDFVTVEFAINDSASADILPFYEQVVRSTLKSKNKPAVMLMFFTTNSGSNAQPIQHLVGKNYNLPMTSYRDAVWPDINAKIMTWEDLYGNDIIHPNDMGHYLMAKFATDRLEDVYRNLDKYTDDGGDEIASPLVSPENFLDGQVLTPKKISPVSKDGWVAAPSSAGFSPDWHKFFGEGWLINKVGATLTFEGIEGNNIGIVYKRSPKDVSGVVDIKIDGESVGSVSAHSTVTYEYPVPEIVARKLADGKHKVEITLREKPGQQAEFNLLAILASRGEKDPLEGRPLVEGLTWSFDEDGDMKGWTENWDVADVKVSGGAISATATDRDPQLISPPGLSIDSSVSKKVLISLKNETAGTMGQVFFITDKDPNWDEPKSVKFKLTSKDTDYTNYIVDFSELIFWNGTITQIRIDPTEVAGEFSVKKIAILEAVLN